VSFSEPGFIANLNQENQFGPWFTLSDTEKQQIGSPMGPQNPQALNRYSYVLNNPVNRTDPSGHAPPSPCMADQSCWYNKVYDAAQQLYRKIGSEILNFGIGLGQSLSEEPTQAGANDWQDAERIVGQRLGLSKNTTKYPVEGKGYQVTPDFVDLRPGGVVAEVKYFEGELSLTNQMRGEIALAQKNNVRYDLYVRQSTTFSNNLQSLIDSGVVNLIRLFE
jgi:hypothetical protein